MQEELQYKRYVAFIQYSENDAVFYGRVLGIDDLVSFEGASEGEVMSCFIEAVDDYLEACEQIGKKG